MTKQTPTAMRLFFAFTQIGLTSFGGGLSGWMLREFVQRRGWINEDEFLSGLALAQAFPGVNVVNLSIWIGYRLRGTPGALAGACGIIIPAAFVAVLILAGFDALSRYPLTHLILAGLGAAAVGLSLQMGVVAVRRAASKGVIPTIIMLAAFLAVGVFHILLPVVVLVLAPISVAFAYRELRRA